MLPFYILARNLFCTLCGCRIPWLLCFAGEVEVCGGPGTPHRGVINMFAQVYPGKFRAGDSEADRLRYFAKCLSRLKEDLQTGGMVAGDIPLAG